MKKKNLLLLVIISLCGYDAFSQETSNPGFIDIHTTIITHKGEKPRPRQYVCAEIKFPSSKAYGALRQGFDVPSKYTTTTALYGGMYFGTEKFHFIPTMGLLWSFNGGYNGWSPAELQFGGTYRFAKRISGTYHGEWQYTLTTDYDLSHIIIQAQGSNFLREYMEATLNVTKSISVGYSAQFFDEISKKDVVLNGVRSTIPLQYDHPRGFFVQATVKNVYLKPQLLWGSEQRASITLGYRQIN